MIRSSPLSALPSTFDDFLYASIGESSNGALLTVLSVLARQNVDPWEEAADLSRLPHDTAARRLSLMITASHGQTSAADQAAIADRLIALLPSRTAPARSRAAPNASQGVGAMHRSPPTVNLMVIAIYICVMVLSQWIAAALFQEAPAKVAAAPTSASTLRERLPSGTDGGSTNKSPQ